MFNLKSLFRDPKLVVSPESLKKGIDVSEIGVIIDIRPQEEYLKGHIVNSISVPLNELKLKIASVAPLKTSRLFCYCEDGEKCYQAAKDMREMGYQLAYGLDGGYRAWIAKGFPRVI